MSANFFYDNQIRRFLLQFIRMMSNFEVEFGKDRNGVTAYQRVPVFYGDQSRQAAAIIRGNSENALPTVPAMAVYISGLDYDRERMQEPYFVSKMNIRERVYDPDTGTYGTQQGDAYTVERMMPVPYKMTLKMDVWTSNLEQKLQLFEQLATLFNPSLEIQSTDNYIDWTSLSVVTLTSTNFDSRNIPMGTDESISVLTYTFDLPIWISPPAKVKKLGVVQKIINSIYDASGNLSDEVFYGGDIMDRKIITPLGYKLLYNGNSLKLLNQGDIVVNSGKVGTIDNWDNLINLYGTLRNGTSEIRIQIADSTDEISGTIAYHPSDKSQLLFSPNVDTLPANTLSPVNAIIDPTKVTVDSSILAPTSGTRYLLLHSIGDADSTEFAVAWPGANSEGLVANANDIVVWNGTYWAVAFDSIQEPQAEYLTNLNTNVQYRWTGESWVKSYEGIYQEGLWSIVL